MFENDIKWVFPETIDDIYENIKDERSMIHAGGLTVNKIRPSKINTLVDLQKAGLDKLEVKENEISIGAYLSVGEMIRNIKAEKYKSDVLRFLSDVFKNAGSTSIRNRITIGGSVVQFPVWSDIVPALVAVDARINIFYGEEETLSIMDFLINKPKRPFILTSVDITEQYIKWFYRRLTNVDFDYSYMNFCAVRKDNDVKCVVTGTKNKIQVFDLNDHENEHIDFRDDIYFSADYKRHLFDVYIKEAKAEPGNWEGRKYV